MRGRSTGKPHISRPCRVRGAVFITALLFACGTFAGPMATPGQPGQPLTLSATDYEARVYAAWIGQIIGNIYGLSYEFRFIEDAGPDDFPYGYGPALDRARELGGAFSDDDTDIEYMYLLQMEQHGIEPTYAQLAAAWKHHVRDRVWVANRSALALMHAGYGPPVTGSRDYNPNWFHIDPQLVNEIWAVTAPGMVDYAVDKSAWAARITSDGFGIEPTLLYAAMYAAAFFEKDIDRLLDIGVDALPAGGRYAAVVAHMRELHERYPRDWRRARAEMAGTYYGEFDYNRGAWPVVDAVLNGAAGILALLYGGGDFQRTLDLACGMGFDADNQAATLSGLLGIVHGLEGIPEALLYPLGGRETGLPFNDRYVNVSRHDLPDASIRDIARRTAAVGREVILAGGGERTTNDGATFYNRPFDDRPVINFYGYRWAEPQDIRTLVFNPGMPEEWGGWFTTLAVHYDDGYGNWVPAELQAVEPPLNFANDQWLKGAYIDHALRIAPVRTRAVRIIGDAGGIHRDERNGGGREFYTAISELAVYPD